jgi:hypothetical protein
MVALRTLVMQLKERIDGLDRLTDAKFTTLRTLIDSQSDKVALALNSSDKAVLKAETATEKRFEGVNEFRQQLADQAGTFIPRKEAEQRMETLLERMETLRHSVSSDDAKLDERLKTLEQGASNMQGRMWALGTAIAAVVIVVNIVIAVFLK